MLLSRKTVVRLTGGLGNQLFQLAAGIQSEQTTGKPLFLDASAYCNYRLHALGIDSFDHNASRCSPQLECLLQHYPRIQSLGLSRAFAGLLGTQAINDRADLTFQPELTRVSGASYWVGYWQSAKYFEAATNSVRERLRLNARLAPQFTQGKQALNRGKAIKVSLHIRRGDYATDASALRTHGLLPLGYFEAAIAKMQQLLALPFGLVVFSDDPQWARANLNTDVPVQVCEAGDPAVDMMLMASCDHHIISNSTFSWWGAWLNPSLTKHVICPKNWFVDPALSDRDLKPAGWIQL